MTISEESWRRYIKRLAKINWSAATQMVDYMVRLGAYPDYDDLIAYAYGLTTKYGEAAAALACEMYDAVALASGSAVPAAVPAEVPGIDEVARAVVGTAKTGNPSLVGQSVGRLVKRTGVDTTMQNALRDGAEWAWIPRGDTCAFCLILASNGWQVASKKALKGGHAEHIHANCDCTYAIRFDSRSNVAGYEPEKYLEMYQNASSGDWRAKREAMQTAINSRHREAYNERKRAEYAARRERAGATYTPRKDE